MLLEEGRRRWFGHYAFLETDAGIKKALEGRPAQEMLRMAEGWRPWRSYATISLWNSLKKEE